MCSLGLHMETSKASLWQFYGVTIVFLHKVMIFHFFQRFSCTSILKALLSINKLNHQLHTMSIPLPSSTKKGEKMKVKVIPWVIFSTLNLINTPVFSKDEDFMHATRCKYINAIYLLRVLHSANQ